jgi:hypothetical protein
MMVPWATATIGATLALTVATIAGWETLPFLVACSLTLFFGSLCGLGTKRQPFTNQGWLYLVIGSVVGVGLSELPEPANSWGLVAASWLWTGFVVWAIWKGHQNGGLASSDQSLPQVSV